MNGSKARWGGILTIIAGAIGILIGIVVAIVNFRILSIFELPAPEVLAGMPSVILGALAVAGGIFAIRKKVWIFALVGAILAIPSTAALGPAVILGILGVLFIAMARNEFD